MKGNKVVVSIIIILLILPVISIVTAYQSSIKPNNNDVFITNTNGKTEIYLKIKEIQALETADIGSEADFYLKITINGKKLIYSFKNL